MTDEIGSFAVSYRYDDLNQLVETITGDKTIAYEYNGAGLRTKKTVNGDTTSYLYEYDKVVLELDGSGNQLAKNVYGLNLVSRTVEEEKLCYFYNGHADATALMDTAGNIKGTYYYDSFGNHIEETGTANNPYRYSGYQYDEETDSYYLNARYYDAKTARFLTEDSYRGTAAEPLSLNVYTYVYNNPIKYWDPTGHFVSRIGNDVPIIKVTNNGQGGVTISQTETRMASADGVRDNNLRYTEISTSTTKTTDTTVSTIKVTTVTDVTKKETTQTTTTNTSTNTTTTTVTTSDGHGYTTVNTSSKTNTQKSSDDVVASENVLLASLMSDFLFLKPIDPNRDGDGKPTAYIFYALSDTHNTGFGDRAKADAERWKKVMGTDAILIPITSEEEFAKYWNEMGKNGEKIQYVGMYFHSNPHNLFINTDNDEYITAFETGYARGNGGPEALTIGSLDKKTIENLYLYSCNSGHLSHLDDNLAVTFLEHHEIKNVYAWDGSMKWSKNGQYTRLAYDREYFESWRNQGEKREASGMIRFYYDEKGNIDYSSVESSNTEWQWFKRFDLWETQYK